MTRNTYQLYRTFTRFGFDPIAFIHSIKGLPYFFKNLKELKKQKASDTTFPFGIKIPILGDRFAEAGTMKGHYFHQDLYVAKQIFQAKPIKHLDIGSRIDGLVTHIAVFRSIDIMDIRAQNSKVPNINFRQADLMQLPDDLLNSYDSISSLHAIEHFGLGRYGDPIDYFGHLKAIENITKMLQVGGTFYFSVPIGNQRIEFNAHRIFSVRYLMEIFSENFELQQLSYVDDKGDFHENINLNSPEIDKNFGCTFGCGIFVLKKL